jgi:hypothetical protein
MSAMPSPAQSEFSEGSLTIKPSGDVPADLRNDQFPHRPRTVAKRASLAFTRFLITFCIGVGATVAWQSYGDTAREVIANASPQFAWLALPAAPVAQDPAETPAPAEPASAPAALPSPDQQQLSAVSLDLDGMRQSVDRVAANQDQMTRTIGQLVAGQEQMTREIAKLQSIEQYILYKNSEPPPRPAAPAAAPRPATRPSPPPPR